MEHLEPLAGRIIQPIVEGQGDEAAVPVRLRRLRVESERAGT
jgi:hypothetical protein